MKRLFSFSGMLSVMLVLGSGCSKTEQQPSASVASRPAPPEIVSPAVAVEPEVAPIPAEAPTYTPPVAVSSSEPASTTEHLRVVEFKIKAPDASNAYLAGEFNDWSETAMPMSRQADGEWTASIALKPGTYQYKFFVDDQWTTDPKNPEHTDDGHGGLNSILQVSEPGGNQ